MSLRKNSIRGFTNECRLWNTYSISINSHLWRLFQIGRGKSPQKSSWSCLSYMWIDGNYAHTCTCTCTFIRDTAFINLTFSPHYKCMFGCFPYIFLLAKNGWKYEVKSKSQSCKVHVCCSAAGIHEGQQLGKCFKLDLILY